MGLGVAVGVAAGEVVTAGLGGVAVAPGEGEVAGGVASGVLVCWQAPNIAVKPSPRARVTIFLFINSLVTDRLKISN